MIKDMGYDDGTLYRGLWLCIWAMIKDGLCLRISAMIKDMGYDETLHLWDD